MIDYYLGFSVLVQQGNVHYLAIYVVLNHTSLSGGGGGNGENVARENKSDQCVTIIFASSTLLLLTCHSFIISSQAAQT